MAVMLLLCVKTNIYDVHLFVGISKNTYTKSKLNGTKRQKHSISSIRSKTMKKKHCESNGGKKMNVYLGSIKQSTDNPSVLRTRNSSIWAIAKKWWNKTQRLTQTKNNEYLEQ